MTKIATFEVCGLSFVLQRLDGCNGRGPEFKLIDEAFSLQPIRFLARSHDELLQKAEQFIGATLSPQNRDLLRAELGDLENLTQEMARPPNSLTYSRYAADLAIGLQ